MWTIPLYRVIVRTATGFRIISIPAPTLLLTELSILVESDRHAIAQQLLAAALLDGQYPVEPTAPLN